VKTTSQHRSAVALVLLAFALLACNEHQTYQAPSHRNAAYVWSEIALECTALDTEINAPRPTVTSRYLALVQTAVFDAWSHYDLNSQPVYLTGVGKHPAVKQPNETYALKEVAIAFAAARTLEACYPECRSTIFDILRKQGHDPTNYTLERNEPAGIGNLAARAVIGIRRYDRSNQFSNTPYVDFTNYAPVNDPDSIVDIIHWTPKVFVLADSSTFVPACLTPHWHWVAPFSLTSASQFRPPPPPSLHSDSLRQELLEVIELQANMTDADKALVEFMRDGPKSVQQAGHWLLFAQYISVRDAHHLDDDVKMYFALTNGAFDAFIACWDAKMHYDYARPQALIHDFFEGDSLNGWMGESQGWGRIPANQWRSYSPASFPCPPFPAYVSGHSTVSACCADILKRFTGSDEFGFTVDLIPGVLTDPNAIGERVTLEFPTFTETADLAGRSRVIGGYHIESDNREGLVLGRKVAEQVWNRYLELVPDHTSKKSALVDDVSH